MKKAIIYWISEEEGGRKRTPIGTEYYPTIQMKNVDTWSLAIRFDRTNVEKNEMKDNCEVGFLFDNAQYNLLKSSAGFIIYEGPHKIGVMVIR